MKKKTNTFKEFQPRSPNNSFGGKGQDKILGASEDVIELILKDHLPLKDLIEKLKDDELERADKEEAFEEFAFFLKGHAVAEEKSLYVAMKNFEALKVPSFEGDTEHAIADQLVQEINAASDDNEWLAKTKVLAELVEHHIEEEENEMLKDVESTIAENIRFKIGAEYTRLFNEFVQLNEIQMPRNIKFPKVKMPPVVSL